MVELHSRQVSHVGVTASPTLAWLKQQLREATPYGLIPRFLIHDNDGRYGQFGRLSLSLDGRKTHRCALDHWLYEVLGVVGS